MAFSLSSLSRGVLTLKSLEAFVDAKLHAFAQRHGLLPTKSAKQKPAVKKAKATAKPAAAKSSRAPSDIDVLQERFETHPKRQALKRVGAKKDQLLRSLIPLSLAKDTKVRVTSGVISAFWKGNGVNYAAPNAAKALRNHPGHTRRAGKTGFAITPKGQQYIAAALKSAR